MTTLLVVEDDPALAARFAHIVAAAPTLTLLDCVGTVRAARQALKRQVPDVLLTDLGLPDGSGIDLIRETAAVHPGTDILVVTVFGDEEHVLASIEAGATGYVLKDAMPAEFEALIAQLRSGGSPISPVIARRMLNRFRSAGRGAPAAAAPGASSRQPPAQVDEAGLSARESEVLGLIAKGFSFADIARLLNVSPHTITAHVKRIYQKLAVHSRGEAVFEATRMGLLWKDG